MDTALNSLSNIQPSDITGNILGNATNLLSSLDLQDPTDQSTLSGIITQLQNLSPDNIHTGVISNAVSNLGQMELNASDPLDQTVLDNAKTLLNNLTSDSATLDSTYTNTLANAQNILNDLSNDNAVSTSVNTALSSLSTLQANSYTTSSQGAVTNKYNNTVDNTLKSLQSVLSDATPENQNNQSALTDAETQLSNLQSGYFYTTDQNTLNSDISSAKQVLTSLEPDENTIKNAEQMLSGLSLDSADQNTLNQALTGLSSLMPGNNTNLASIANSLSNLTLSKLNDGTAQLFNKFPVITVAIIPTTQNSRDQFHFNPTLILT